MTTRAALPLSHSLSLFPFCDGVSGEGPRMFYNWDHVVRGRGGGGSWTSGRRPKPFTWPQNVRWWVLQVMVDPGLVAQCGDRWVVARRRARQCSLANPAG